VTSIPLSSSIALPQSPAAKVTVNYSLIIVSYNSRVYLQECLSSVLATTGPNCEILLVDNASGDGSADFVAQNFPEVSLIRNPRNSGFAAANNQAARLAQGRFIVALNPDTKVSAGWLEALLEPFANDPAVGLTTPKILMLNNPAKVNTCGNSMHYSGLTTCRGLGFSADTLELAQSCEVSAVSGACFVIRRELWETLGGFDETFFTYLEDTDLSLRARLAGYKSQYMSQAVVYHDYANRFSPAKIYYLERNRLLMLGKSFELKTLLWLLPALLLTELITWGYALLNGWAGAKAKIRAYLWLLQNLEVIREKRCASQLLRRVSDKVLLDNCAVKLDISQLAGPKLGKLAGFTVNPFYRVWFGLTHWFVS